MPRYFFHLRDGQDIPDGTGTVCADPQDARAQAGIVSGALLKDLGARFWREADWGMHVTDDQGATLCDPRFTGTARAI